MQDLPMPNKFVFAYMCGVYKSAAREIKSPERRLRGVSGVKLMEATAALSGHEIAYRNMFLTIESYIVESHTIEKTNFDRLMSTVMSVRRPEYDENELYRLNNLTFEGAKEMFIKYSQSLMDFARQQLKELEATERMRIGIEQAFADYGPSSGKVTQEMEQKSEEIANKFMSELFAMPKPNLPS